MGSCHAYSMDPSPFFLNFIMRRVIGDFWPLNGSMELRAGNNPTSQCSVLRVGKSLENIKRQLLLHYVRKIRKRFRKFCCSCIIFIFPMVVFKAVYPKKIWVLCIMKLVLVPKFVIVSLSLFGHFTAHLVSWRRRIRSNSENHRMV